VMCLWSRNLTDEAPAH